MGVGTAVLLLFTALAVPVGVAGFSLALTDGDVPPLSDQLFFASLAIMAFAFVAAVFATAKVSGGWVWALAYAPMALGVVALGFLRPDPPFAEVFPSFCTAYFAVSALALRPRRVIDGFVRLLFLAFGVVLILAPQWDELLLGFCILPWTIAASGLAEALSLRIFRSTPITAV